MPAIEDGYVIGGEATGQPMQLPVVDIVEVGAGGGSIAWCDPTGGIHVGPKSAGADPGPACLRQGLDRSGGDRRQSGARPHQWRALSQRRDEARRESGRARHRSKLAGPARLGVQEAALGIVHIADAAMSLAVRAVSVKRGVDPRDTALIAFGGAGPLHAVAIAREIFIPKVIVPKVPGTFSALGMLMASWRQDFVRRCSACSARSTRNRSKRRSPNWPRPARRGRARRHRRQAPPTSPISPICATSARSTPLPLRCAIRRLDGRLRAAARAFDAEHDQRYGHAAPDESMEIVNMRLVVTAPRTDTLAERWLSEPWTPEPPSPTSRAT